MKVVTMSQADRAAHAREQIAFLKSDRRRWVQLQNQDAHKADALDQIMKIDAEIRRFIEWGGLSDGR